MNRRIISQATLMWKFMLARVGPLFLLAATLIYAQQPRDVMAVIQLADNGDVPTAALRQKIDAESVKTLPRSGSQVWKVDAASVDGLNQLSKSGVLKHFELTQGIIPAVPAESVPTAQLTQEIQSRLRQIVGDLPATEYRVSEKRPDMLSAGPIHANLSSGAISIDLLNGYNVISPRRGHSAPRRR